MSGRERALPLAAALWAGLLLAAATGEASPRLEVEPPRWNLGRITRHQSRGQTFHLANVGDGGLVISQVRSSCEECVRSLRERWVLRAGESRPLAVLYHAVERPGPHLVTLTIHSNDPTRPLYQLVLESEIVSEEHPPAPPAQGAGVRLSSDRLDLGLLWVGYRTRFRVLVENPTETTCVVRSASTTEGCSLRTKLPMTVPAEATGALEVSLSPEAPGPVQERCSFSLDGTEGATLTLLLEGRAEKPTVGIPPGLLVEGLSGAEGGDEGLRPLAGRCAIVNTTDRTARLTFRRGERSLRSLDLGPMERYLILPEELRWLGPGLSLHLTFEGGERP